MLNITKNRLQRQYTEVNSYLVGDKLHLVFNNALEPSEELHTVTLDLRDPDTRSELAELLCGIAAKIRDDDTR